MSDSARAIRTSAFVGASLDGFLARPDGALDWLMGSGETPGESAGEAGPPPDVGYGAFIATVDVLVLGRGTYEKVLTFEKWPYGDLPVRVLTTRPLAIPPELAGKVETRSGPPADLRAGLAREGFRHAYVDGGKTIQGFLAAGALDRFVVTRVPVLIGTGIPLFGPLPGDVTLRHVRTAVIPGGAVQSEYEVIRPA